ncbi:MAG: lysophospholipid acyltransferase family protein [Geobacteraceae bacterium]|nr:lysophospholipid acyltransferase family protein [Geobacteraceae bacterium]
MPRAIFFLFLFVPLTLFVIITGVPITFLDPTGKFLHSYSKLWAKVGLFFAGVKIQVHGTDKIPAGVPLIFMGNHQSNFDILTLYSGLPHHFSWIAKQELFRIPLFGYAMKRAGYLPLDRSDGRQALKTMEFAAKKIRDGVSVMVFPEGTRSMDGKLLPFKRGGFLLAARAGVPIVPFTISGSAQVNPPKRLAVRKGVISIRFADPIPTTGATGKRRDELISRVREAIEGGFED